jgi:DNA-binding transcriptional MerR regulator
MSKASEAFRTISEVSDELDVPKHVLRFWEVKFPQIRPMKRGGGRRYYRPEDLELLRGIRHLLHAEKYTIKGVQKILREQGIDQVKTIATAARSSSAASRAKRSRRATAAPPVAAVERAPVASVLNNTEKIALIRKAIAELEACRAMLKDEPIARETRRGGRRTANAAARP